MRRSVFRRIPHSVIVAFSILTMGSVFLAPPARAGIPDPGQSSISFPSQSVLCWEPFQVPVVVRDGAGIPVGGAFVQLVINVASGSLDPGEPVLYSAVASSGGLAVLDFPSGINGEATVEFEVYADGILLDISGLYTVAKPCVSISGFAVSEVCFGDQVQYTVQIQNCGTALTDIDVLCTVGGFPAPPAGPSFFPAVPPGATVETAFIVDCVSPGEVIVECTADAYLTEQPGCAAVGFFQSSVTCQEPCVDITVPGATACVGEVVQLPLEVSNCGTDPLDITIDCLIDGVPQAPVVFPNVAPGEVRIVFIDVQCTGPGALQVECTATAQSVGNPDCLAIDQDLAFVDCLDPCVDVIMTDVPACAGEQAEVLVTIENCGNLQLDMTLDCQIDGVSQTPIVFNGVNPGETRLVLIPLTCSSPGDILVSCLVTAEEPGNPVCSASDQDVAIVTCMGDAPVITSIQDVPNDQGRRVRIQWQGSCSDYSIPQTVIEDYSIWRRVDPIPALSLAGRAETIFPQALPPGDWDYVATVPALGEQDYGTVVETLCDSTDATGLCLSTFVVVAMTPDPQESYVSLPGAGYSLDNLAPSAPGGLMLVSATLSWNESQDPDFNYFTIYGANIETLDPSAVVLGQTVDPTFSILGAPHVFYLVTATDFAGNEGPPSPVLNPLAVPEVGTTPDAFALYQSRPNPFRSSTLIAFDLPTEEHVRLQVFDVHGRLVKTVLDEVLAPSRYTVPWSGVDQSGARVTPGVYLYRLEARSFTTTRKMILMR